MVRVQPGELLSAATVTGLLADETRLRVVAAIALGARTSEDVAREAGLPLTAVHATLPRLVAGGLVTQEDGLHVSLDALRAAARERAPRNRELPGATPEQAKVLRNFVEDGRLVRLPARAGQRRVVLEYAAGLFERGREYSEPAVNLTLGVLHPDHAALRRYLVDEGLLERSAGVYRRV